MWKKHPLGQGSVKNAQEFLDDTFIVISEDALTDIHLQDALDFHRKERSKATLVLKKRHIPWNMGSSLPIMTGGSFDS